MDDSLIKSSQNKVVKYVASLKQKKKRDEEKLFIIEGEKFVSEIPKDWEIDFYVFSESYSINNSIEVFKNRAEAYILKDSVFDYVSETVNPQGIMAICKQKIFDFEQITNKKDAFLIILEEINDPGNLGTIIRTADAAGADGILLSKKCAEIYNSKTIRASAGSIFNIAFICELDLTDILSSIKHKNIKTYAAHLKAQTYPYDMDLTKSVALLIGNEAKGLSDEITEQSDYLMKLPILGKAESLNASVAGGILMYEVLRQRITK